MFEKNGLDVNMSTELDDKVLRKATPSGGWREPTVIAASFVNLPPPDYH